LAALTPTPDWLGLVLLAGAGAIWLVAYAGGVLVVKELALVATIWATVIAILGRQIARAIMFPLGFLLLGVTDGRGTDPAADGLDRGFHGGRAAALRNSRVP